MVFILSSCQEKYKSDQTNTPDPCSSERIERYIENAEEKEMMLEHLVAQADETPSEELETLIKKMQGVEAELKEIDTPVCALKTNSALESYMETKIQGYFTLYTEGLGIQSKADQTSEEIFDLAETQKEYYESILAELKNVLTEKQSE